jgi:hypothetical protein
MGLCGLELLLTKGRIGLKCADKSHLRVAGVTKVREGWLYV